MHIKKMIAPVLITILLLLYFIGYGCLCIFLDLPFIVKLLGAVILLALAGVAVAVLIQRIHEIRSGEEDDLGKY